MLKVQRDLGGQPYIELPQGGGKGYKRVWIQRRSPESEKDWASAKDRRYINVARIEKPGGGPAGNPVDFPVFSDLPDEQLLLLLGYFIVALTGDELEDS